MKAGAAPCNATARAVSLVPDEYYAIGMRIDLAALMPGKW